MKVTKHDTSFKPFTLNIAVETEEEARALFAIFNHMDNARLIADRGGMGHEPVGDALGGMNSPYRTLKGNDVIARGITHKQFYVSRK